MNPYIQNLNRIEFLITLACTVLNQYTPEKNI